MPLLATDWSTQSYNRFILLDIILRYFLIFDLSYIEAAYHTGRTVILDLDNTIFPEISFLEIRYKYVCQNLFPHNWTEPYQFLLDEFANHGRSNLFDKFIACYNPTKNVSEILDIFRCYDSSSELPLEPYPWFRKLSKRLNRHFPLFIITNGNKSQQEQKINNLNLINFFPSIYCVFAIDYGGKPRVEPFMALARKVQINQPLYIGDSQVDADFCKACKIEFFDVKKAMS